MPIEKIMYALQKFYVENGEDKPTEYMYGFLDALGVIRDMQSQHHN